MTFVLSCKDGVVHPRELRHTPIASSIRVIARPQTFSRSCCSPAHTHRQQGSCLGAPPKASLVPESKVQPLVAVKLPGFRVCLVRSLLLDRHGRPNPLLSPVQMLEIFLLRNE